MPCFMKQLHRDFSDHLVGLKIDSNGRAEIWDPAFSCCAKRDLNSLSENGGLRICQREKRLSWVNEVLRSYEETWAEPFPFFHLRNDKMIEEFIERLRSFRRDHEVCGKALSSSSGLRPSPYIWLMAIVSVWRFGYSAHVVTLGRCGAEQLLPKYNSRQMVVLVDQCTPLRFPHISSDFNTLVSWCERSLVPLWIDVFRENVNSSQSNSKGSLDVQAAFKERIARYKNLPALSWIDANCRSRLAAICTEFQKFC